MDKLYLSAQGLLEDSFRLAQQVHASGFRPTFIVALWRGGAPIGLAVQEYLAHRGVPSDHIALRTSSYTGIDSQAREVAVHGLGYLVKNVEATDRLLIVDDVFDTGRTVAAVIDTLRRRVRANMPADVRIAVPYYKPSRREVELAPDYFLHETEAWLKYPHSLEGLSLEEMRENRPTIWSVLAPLLEPVGDGTLYHLVPEARWTQAVVRGETYYPETFTTDGFTHATARPELLLSVANHFYREQPGHWRCLRMSVESLSRAGIVTVYEGAAAVGDKAADFDGSVGERFPHLQGGIPPSAVLSEHLVTRGEDGSFLAIDGLVEGA